jgi:hypothetical protein
MRAMAVWIAAGLTAGALCGALFGDLYMLAGMGIGAAAELGIALGLRVRRE